MDAIATPTTPSPEPEPESGPWLRLEQHRRELTGHCRRMLGSAFEAEDAVQETLVRAWRGYERFEGRATLRSWLHRIATNVCVDMIRMPQRRPRPLDLGPESELQEVAVTVSGAGSGPYCRRLPGGQTVPVPEDPAERVEAAEAVQEAFATALRHLPPRQRAVLILREVLRWRADEVAELLGTSVAGVNSALQRARATLATAVAAGNGTGNGNGSAGPHEPGDGSQDGAGDAPAPLDESQRRLLAGYVEAFDRLDVEALVSLLQDDATGSLASVGAVESVGSTGAGAPDEPLTLCARGAR